MQALNGYHGIDEDDSYPLYVVLLTVSIPNFSELIVVRL